MADTSNLTNFLGDIADAIRTKKETTEQIPAENFDTEILSIETGASTSDATATADDILSPKTAYAGNKKITGAMNVLTSDSSVPVLDASNITNNTGYSILDINNTLKLAILKISDSQIKVCKIVDNIISVNDCVSISNSDLVTVENKNLLMDAKFMHYDDADSSVGIAAVVLTNYTPWVSKYSGVIQYINKTTLELNTKVSVTAEIPTDATTPSGLVLPRPLHKDCFAYYGFFNTNGKQHCLISYSVSNNKLVTSTLFATNYESHGTNRFGCWVPDGKLLYVTDLSSTYYVYLVSDDNTKWIRTYTNSIIPLTSSIGIKNGNNIVDLTTNNVVGTTTFTLNNLSSNWIVNNSYLYMYDSSVVRVYNVDAVITELESYNINVDKLFRTDTIYFLSSMIVKFISTSIEKSIYCITRKGKNFWDTLDTTAEASDLLETKTAYINGSKMIGAMLNNGELNFTPSDDEQLIPAGYTSGGKISAVDITSLSDYDTCLNKTKAILGITDIIPVLNGLVLDLEANSDNVTNSDGVIWTDSINSKQISINNGSVDTDNSIIFNGTNTSFDSGITQEELKNGYTVITRIRPTEWGNYKGVFGLHGSAGLVGLQYQDGLIYYSHLPIKNKITISPDVLAVNAWHNVACSYYGTTGKIYVDGELVASGKLDTLSPLGNLIFGYCYNESNRYFKGNISHCIVYNRGLSDLEVQMVNNYIGGVE